MVLLIVIWLWCPPSMPISSVRDLRFFDNNVNISYNAWAKEILRVLVGWASLVPVQLHYIQYYSSCPTCQGKYASISLLLLSYHPSYHGVMFDGGLLTTTCTFVHIGGSMTRFLLMIACSIIFVSVTVAVMQEFLVDQTLRGGTLRASIGHIIGFKPCHHCQA